MNFAIMVSGTGSNLQALLEAEAAGRLAPGRIGVVISNRPGVAALDKAAQAGKTALTIDHRAYPTREVFEEAILETLAGHGAEAILLAGFMRVLGPRFLSRFPDRILNIHPSLLPAFPGLDAQRQAWEHGVKVAGCTVHFVDASLDGGAIVLQAAVPVHEDDDLERLRARILEREHEILPSAAQLLAAGRLVRAGRRVKIVP